MFLICASILLLAMLVHREWRRARLGGFLARKSDGEPGWQTIWKGWFVLMTGVSSPST
jgi:hypothetical protein